MPGLYNAIFGENPHAVTLVHWLGLRRRDLGRYRDAYKTDAGEIAIYCRLGGGNREAYQHVIDTVRQHPLFKRDVDDDFDSTYLTFYFTCPVPYADAFATMPSERDRSTLWEQKLAQLETMTAGEAEALVARVNENTTVLTADGPTTVTEFVTKMATEGTPSS